MPKKGKGGKGKGKTVSQLDEVTAKSAKDRLEQQLSIKNTQYQNLQKEYQRTQDLIHTLEHKLRKETGSLKQTLQLRNEEHTSIVEELEFEVISQREKIKLYESQVHAAEIVVAENETLRRRVTNLNEILQAQSAEHAQLVHSLNSDKFNIRLQLEQAFRKALAEAKDKSQEDALEAMTDESKKAIQLNRKLTSELQAQSRGIRKMCEHFDMRDEELKAAKLQSRLNKSQIDSMTGELTRLARVIQKQTREMAAKDVTVKSAVKDLEESEARAEKLKEEVRAHKNTISEKDTYIKTMQSRIYFLSEKLTKLEGRRSTKMQSRIRTARQASSFSLFVGC